jgi:hypothetical protein
LQSFPEYEQNKEFYLSAFEEAHQKAFSESYTMGGRRRAAKFDSETYVRILIDRIKYQAEVAGKTSLAYSLNDPQRFFSMPVAESGGAEKSRY